MNSQVAIIAGNKGDTKGTVFDGENDGLVSVDSAIPEEFKLDPHVKDIKILPINHSELLFNNLVLNMIVNFLNKGEF